MQGMDHCVPLELLYKFNYLLTNSDWGDYSVWLSNLAIKCGYCIDTRIVQPPKAMEGKWGTISAAGEWAIKHWDLLLMLAHECSIGVRAGGLISSQHFQMAEWKRVKEWMLRPTMKTAIAWTTELSNVAVGWQNWSKAEGQFGISFRTTELARAVMLRVKQAQEMAKDPWSTKYFPRAAALKAKIPLDPLPDSDGDTYVDKIERQTQSAATVFEEEARFWMQNCVRLPIAFWLFTDPKVGPYFLSKVLEVVEPDWEIVDDLEWAASAQEQTEIDAFFTLEWHADFLRELTELGISKCRKKDGLISEYDFKADLKRFWVDLMLVAE